MNPLRPLLRSSLPTIRPITASSSALAGGIRRQLTTPTSPALAKVSDATVDITDRVREDPGEFDMGDSVAEHGEGGEGESSGVLSSPWAPPLVAPVNWQ